MAKDMYHETIYFWGRLLDKPRQNFGVGINSEIVATLPQKDSTKLVATALPVDPDEELKARYRDDCKQLTIALGKCKKYSWECGIEKCGRNKRAGVFLGWGDDVYGENVVFAYKQKDDELYEVGFDEDFYFKYVKDIIHATDNVGEYYADNVSLDDLIKLSKSLENL